MGHGFAAPCRFTVEVEGFGGLFAERSIWVDPGDVFTAETHAIGRPPAVLTFTALRRLGSALDDVETTLAAVAAAAGLYALRAGYLVGRSNSRPQAASWTWAST